MSNKDKIIIIPAYNEEKNLPSLINELKTFAPDYDRVFIDDGSYDNTADLCRLAGEKIVIHPANLGAGGAIETGLKYAWNNNYRYAMVCDGDGQHDPKYAKLLFDSCENHNQVVIGSRFLQAKKYINTTFLKSVAMSFFSKWLSWHLGYRVWDTTSGYRVYPKNVIEYLKDNFPNDYPDANMLLSLHYKNFTFKEIPYICRERQAGRSMFTLYKSLYYPFRVSLSMINTYLKKD